MAIYELKLDDDIYNPYEIQIREDWLYANLRIGSWYRDEQLLVFIDKKML